jgi:putative phosphoesterase
MRIGVVGDTHNNLASVRRIVEILAHVRVERVVHTGDITQAKVLDCLSEIEVPIHGVYGNNDLERDSLMAAADRHGMQLVDGPLELHWAQRRIVIAHDPLDLDPHIAPHHDLAIHGHTHLHRHETIEGTLIFNPGECAGMLPGHNRVGVVDLVSLECTLHHF